MKPALVSLSRLEFSKFNVEINPDYNNKKNPDNLFPQLDFDFNNVKFELGADLSYHEEEVNDPRHFTLMLRVSIQQKSQDDEIVIPYSVLIEGFAYLFFKGKESVSDRFKFIRGTGYMMLYGAFRETIANFTGRSAYGVWFLPSLNFNSRVDDDVPNDIKNWERLMGSASQKTVEISEDVLTSAEKKLGVNGRKNRIAKH